MPHSSRASKEYWDKKKRSRPKEARPGKSEALTSTQGGRRPQSPQDAEQKGQVYLMEAADGTLVRVPEEKLTAWMNAQDAIREAQESKDKGQLLDAVTEMLYGKEEKQSR